MQETVRDPLIGGLITQVPKNTSPIGFGTDSSTGDAFEVKPDPVSVTLVPVPAAGVPVPTVKAAPLQGDALLHAH
jgi:hypothetical protein